MYSPENCHIYHEIYKKNVLFIRGGVITDRLNYCNTSNNTTLIPDIIISNTRCPRQKLTRS